MSFHAVDLNGKSRELASAPIRMHLEDVALDGRILLSTELCTGSLASAKANPAAGSH